MFAEFGSVEWSAKNSQSWLDGYLFMSARAQSFLHKPSSTWFRGLLTPIAGMLPRFIHLSGQFIAAGGRSPAEEYVT
jgi:hypothetical protein